MVFGLLCLLYCLFVDFVFSSHFYEYKNLIRFLFLISAIVTIPLVLLIVTLIIPILFFIIAMMIFIRKDKVELVATTIL